MPTEDNTYSLDKRLQEDVVVLAVLPVLSHVIQSLDRRRNTDTTLRDVVSIGNGLLMSMPDLDDPGWRAGNLFMDGEHFSMDVLGMYLQVTALTRHPEAVVAAIERLRDDLFKVIFKV